VDTSAFTVYLDLGFKHIADFSAYDHILFIVVLCAIYRFHQWKQVVILVTAFTLGHSLTLALAALDRISIPAALIEFLIPLTIVATALYNVISVVGQSQQRGRTASASLLTINYLLAAVFGLIHGLGFSNFFRSALLPGEENALLLQLFAFNLGVELGQLAILVIIFLIGGLAMGVLSVKQREWNLFVSGAAFGLAFVMMLERLPW
jgi:hypothetical protein